MQFVLVVGVRVAKAMPSGDEVDATHALERVGELDSMRLEYSEPLALCFPRQGTHESWYVVHRVDGCARTRFFILKKMSWPLKKAKSRQRRNNEQHKRGAKQPEQSGVHSANHTLQQPGIPQFVRM